VQRQVQAKPESRLAGEDDDGKESRRSFCRRAVVTTAATCIAGELSINVRTFG
jgi:hypothetical protein